MTEEENVWLALLGGAGVLIAAFLGMNASKTTTSPTASQATAAPKMKTGCGCNKGL
jgi:hypothetical protein